MSSCRIMSKNGEYCMENNQNKYKNKIITIPNTLSFFRLCLIPVIIWIYLGLENYIFAGFMVFFSGLTDLADGYIARKFNMISDIGKVLDPIADKGTQCAVVLLLATKFPFILAVAALIVIKETFMGITGYMIVKKCDIVLAAEWYGKLSSLIINSVVILLLLFPAINPLVSNILIIITALSILMALILYAIRNFRYLRPKN